MRLLRSHDVVDLGLITGRPKSLISFVPAATCFLSAVEKERGAAVFFSSGACNLRREKRREKSDGCLLRVSSTVFLAPAAEL